MLAGGIYRQAAKRSHTGVTANDDDFAPASIGHLFEGRSKAICRALAIHVNCLIPLIHETVLHLCKKRDTSAAEDKIDGSDLIMTV